MSRREKFSRKAEREIWDMKRNLAILGLAGLLAVAGGGALAYVRLKKTGKHRKPAYDYALDDEEDEEQSE